MTSCGNEAASTSRPGTPISRAGAVLIWHFSASPRMATTCKMLHAHPRAQLGPDRNPYRRQMTPNTANGERRRIWQIGTRHSPPNEYHGTMNIFNATGQPVYRGSKRLVYETVKWKP